MHTNKIGIYLQPSLYPPGRHAKPLHVSNKPLQGYSTTLESSGLLTIQDPHQRVNTTNTKRNDSIPHVCTLTNR